MKLPRLPRTFDWLLYFLPLALFTFGVLAIWSVTAPATKNLALNQVIYGALGVVAMIVLTFFDYRNLKPTAPYLYGGGLILLGLVLVVGKTAFGATRWIELGGIQIQPAELAKLFLLLFVSRLLADRIAALRFWDILLVLGAAFIPAFLVLRQPDFGTAIVLLVGSSAILLAGSPKPRQLLTLALGVLASLPLAWFYLKDYQRERIMTFLNPARDPYGSGYNVIQSIIAVGNGGLLGKGLGEGSQSQLAFLPVAHTDFIFSVVAEATGFIGSTILVALLLWLVLRVIRVAQISKDSFGMLFAVGYGATLLFQVLVNIGMNLGIMPVTGVPLPFVSYGGTAIILNFAAVGILQSIYMRHKKISF